MKNEYIFMSGSVSFTFYERFFARRPVSVIKKAIKEIVDMIDDPKNFKYEQDNMDEFSCLYHDLWDKMKELEQAKVNPERVKVLDSVLTYMEKRVSFGYRRGDING